MGYETKFNLGQRVYFVDTEVVDQGSCECCGKRKDSETVEKIRYSKVVGIHIDERLEGYQLVGIYLTSNWLFETKEEAEESIKSK